MMSQAEGPYQLATTKAAERALERLPEKDRRRVADKVRSLANDPRPHGAEKLTDRGDLYRIRSGNYRIIYGINDAARTVDVRSIGDRKDIYRH
jgi:mRNA interferase RelE/StbE